MSITKDLHARLIDQIRADGWIITPCIEDAMRAVPRHLFLPDAPAQEAYADKNVATKTDPAGAVLSSASTPSIVAMMLEQAGIEPGHRVLEIGAGTGYNAALLRHLTGDSGQVATVDIDPDAVEDTRKNLSAAGYNDIQVTCGDGECGIIQYAPYDRIIVTAGAWDLPPAWREQLINGGRMVVPVRFRGTTRSIAFQREGDRLVSGSVKLCGFIPMRNDDGEHILNIAEGVALRFDEDQDITPTALDDVLSQPKTEAWSDVTVGVEPIHGIWGRLVVAEAGTCRISADADAVQSGRAVPVIPPLSPAVVEGASLAYLTHRPLAGNGQKRSELGAIGHGPAGEELCRRMIEHVHQWDTDRTDRLVVTAFPADTPDNQLSEGRVIDKRQARLSVSWA
ncbi:MAG: methyltransferase, FxLD system [Pseudonocardiaceae bacterium]